MAINPQMLFRRGQAACEMRSAEFDSDTGYCIDAPSTLPKGGAVALWHGLEVGQNCAERVAA
jgi:nitrite reductase/ring-hydroxylating ferredoxin subunit